MRAPSHFAYAPIHQDDIEMDDKPHAQLPVVEDVEDQEERSLASEDKDVMVQMGKRQQLKRRFGIFTIFGLSMTLLSSWEAIGG